MNRSPLSNVLMFAAAGIGVAAVGFVAWRLVTGSAPSSQALRERPSALAPPASTPPPLAPTAEIVLPAAKPAVPGPAPTAARSPAAVQPPTALMAQPPALPAPKIPLPEFDVVRVEPTGETVVAGRAPARATVALFNGDRKVGEASADAGGQFVIVPPALPPGEHLLSLRVAGPDAEIVSQQTVAIAVTGKTGEKTVVALAEPGKPTVVLGEPRQPPPAAVASSLSIRTVEAGEEGAFFATGAAAPGGSVRLYLNAAPIATVQAAPDGKWALRVDRGMAPGHYDVRADMVEPGTGRVLARAEVPFDYPLAQGRAVASTPPVQTATAPAPSRLAPSAPSAPAVTSAPPGQTGAAPRQPAASAPTPAIPPASPPAQTTAAPATVAIASPPAPAAAQPGLAIVPEVTAVTVQRGDNLWRISRKVLGKGARYTQIYEANASQIRDPNRIWPGQIFVAPQSSVQ